jgi:hypothetical protein
MVIDRLVENLTDRREAADVRFWQIRRRPAVTPG